MDSRLRKEIGKIEKSKKNKKFQCLYPNCSSMSIGSHSQQRGGQLKIISKNDEVYCANFNLYEAFIKGEKAFSLLKTNIKNASVYPGYCQYHDGVVFSSIEKTPLSQNCKVQAATLFLRAVTYEVTRKKLIDFVTQQTIKNCSNLLSPEITHQYKLQKLGREKFIKHDLPFYLDIGHKAQRDPALDFIKTKWVVIPKVIKASSCTTFSPIRDFQERTYHQACFSPQFITTFNLIPAQNETHVVVSWLDEHSVANKWIEDAMDSNLEQFVNYIALCESEDVCLGPDLWEQVNIFDRECVYEAMQHEVYRGALAEIPRVIKI